MIYKLLEKNDMELMREILEDDNTIFDILQLNKFINDKNTLGFIAKTENKIVGFGYGYTILHPDGRVAFFLYSIGMLPKYRDKGYGTQLLSFIKDYVKNIGCFEMFVLTDKGNPRACHVYEKLGGKNDYDDEICYVYNLEITENFEWHKFLIKA